MTELDNCAQSIWPLISNINGSLSFISSFISLLPQIIETYHDKTVIGLSPYFLLAWLCGDITSLIGAILTDQLSFQIILAIYFLFNDLFVCGQYYYYGIIHKNKLATMSHEPKPLLTTIDIDMDNNTNSNTNGDDDHSSNSNGLEAIRSRDSSQRRAALITALTIANSINSAEAQSLPPPSSSPVLRNNRIGTILSWMGASFYVGARIPQLYRNYKRKSTDGLSPFLFATTLLGNITYNVSIFTSCNVLMNDDKIGFIKNEMPFIFGSAGTIIFDLIYFYQYYVLYADDLKLRELEREIMEECSNEDVDGQGVEVSERTALLL
ncbi:Ypq2p NDAI_0C04660 [Naumovozyma dairenensis CBS 421]|uniref:Uncharacterized protein n=1 Tax=Naumovozyma dairenensis (strain ATCC 10597 / BCRC 20456 / CBS 421 / NBRC 0211 / NRRL Y-12639) TaxID=1071378 RepID=G0W8L4_NAUDC|nr:hypothetical protein NDAI_0C04660 [Naumovozyma dairenensis CBS 421]CCD24125.1 hypothetical protein NDAI_0C04660 [Naumovozyma dairenensis CBS 421]